MSKVLIRVVVYGLLTLVGFLLYQHAVIYIQGIERNPYQTIYRNKTPYLAKEAKLKKGEERVLKPCVPLQVISEVAHPAVPANRDSQKVNGQQPHIVEPEQSELQLVNRWTIQPSLDPLRAELYLKADGSTSLSLTPTPQIVALGRLREFGLWSGYSYQSEASHSSYTSWFLELKYQQDLLKIGPVMTRLSSGVGYDNFDGAYAHVELGVVVRF